MNSLRILLLPFFLLLGVAGATAQDSDEDAIKTRLLERVAEVDALKSGGLVGENNRGLLEQRGALTPAQTQVLNAENTDRRALYGILASRLGLTAAVVGEGRAEGLRKNSAPGVWLQAPDGSWFKK